MRSTYIFAFIIAVALIGWLFSGVNNDERPMAAPISEQVATSQAVVEDQRVKVRARHQRASLQAAEITVRGSTEAKRVVEVRAEINGRVISPPVDNGALVARGDTLCRLDPAERQARVDEASAALQQTQLEFQGLRKLQTRGLQSETQVASARARVAAAQANLRQRQLELARTSVRAPFAGRLEERAAELGAYLMPGQICATVVAANPMLVTGQVSERDVGSLQPGLLARAKLATGGWVEGEITFIGLVAQSSTRTYRVEMTVPNEDFNIRSGVTAELHIPKETLLAHQVSAALLALDDAGRPGIRILDDERRVQFMLVDIVRDAPGGIWVSGLPELATIITVGQELVVPGQIVDVEFEGQPAPSLDAGPIGTAKGKPQSREGTETKPSPDPGSSGAAVDAGIIAAGVAS